MVVLIGWSGGSNGVQYNGVVVLIGWSGGSNGVQYNGVVALMRYSTMEWWL